MLNDPVVETAEQAVEQSVTVVDAQLEKTEDRVDIELGSAELCDSGEVDAAFESSDESCVAAEVEERFVES